MEVAADEIVKGLIKKNSVGHSKRSAVDAFLVAVQGAYNYDQGNRLAALLPYISELSTHQEELLIEKYNVNSQIYQAYDFSGVVVGELERITGSSYFVEAGRLGRA